MTPALDPTPQGFSLLAVALKPGRLCSGTAECSKNKNLAFYLGIANIFMLQVMCLDLFPGLGIEPSSSHQKIPGERSKYLTFKER